MNQALLLIDIQNDYFPGGAMELVGSPEAGAQAGKLLTAFREKALPVIHIQHISSRPGAAFFLPHTKGVEIHQSVNPAQNEMVIRKNYPGQGEPALLGGIMSTGSVLDSGLYTILKEVKEEANLSLKYLGDLAKLREDYSNSPISVTVHGFEILDPTLRNLKASIQYIITLPTSAQELNSDGTKRVYLAIAYAMLIDVGNTPLSKNNLKLIFTAGDDAQGIYIQDVSLCFTSGDFSHIPPFGVQHHALLFQAMVNFYRQH